MIYIVSGFPRSGTTALTKAIDAGGIEAVRNQERTRDLKRMTFREGDDFNANADFEVTVAERNEVQWPRQHVGKVVKVPAPWIAWLACGVYKVAYMRRPTEEIRQSNEGAFNTKMSNESIDANIEESLAILHDRRGVIQIVEIWYDDLLANPERELSRLGWPIDIEKAAKVINPELKHFNLVDLVVGA